MPAKLHPLVQRTIHRARAAGAQVDIVDDFADIAHLNTLAAALDHPDLETRLSILHSPVTVGDVTLRRLSVAAEEWLAEHRDWFTSSRMETLALAYVMSHKAHDVLSLGGRVEAWARIRAWSLTVRASFDALAEGVAALLLARAPETPESAKPGKDTPEAETAGCGALVALLVREYGHTVDYWLFEAPADLARYLIEGDFLPRRRAEEQAYRSASTKISAPKLTYQAVAHRRFVEASQAWLSRKTKAA